MKIGERFQFGGLGSRAACIIFVGVCVLLGMGAGGSTTCAQPNIPSDRIPIDIPYDVRAQIKRLYSDDPIDRESAAFFLRKMNKLAIPAIPFLVSILDDDEMIHYHPLSTSPSKEAAETLVILGKPAVKPLINAVVNGNLGIRRMAIQVLGRIGDPSAVEVLRNAMNDKNRNVRLMAAWALAQIGKPAVESLITILEDKNSLARGDAAWALGKIGDPRAVEPLMEILKEEDEDIKKSVVEALQKLTGIDYSKRAKKEGQ